MKWSICNERSRWDLSYCIKMLSVHNMLHTSKFPQYLNLLAFCIIVKCTQSIFGTKSFFAKVIVLIHCRSGKKKPFSPMLDRPQKSNVTPRLNCSMSTNSTSSSLISFEVNGSNKSVFLAVKISEHCYRPLWPQ